MEPLLSICSGGIAGAMLAFLLRGWISERLKQSIHHEYAQRLETHKADLNARIQTISHENQLYQLRTSLFFDHQRQAFTRILSAVVEATAEWWRTFDLETGLTEPVPHNQYEAVKRAFYEHQLFLDGDCIASVSLVLDSMVNSFPFVDANGAEHCRDVRRAYETVKFLQDRLAEVFQEKIGLDVRGTAKREIALLGAIRLLNHYHFSDIQLPVRGELSVGDSDTAADEVRKAEDNIDALQQKLGQLADYLRKNPSCFSDAGVKIARYTKMLNPSKQESNNEF